MTFNDINQYLDSGSVGVHLKAGSIHERTGGLNYRTFNLEKTINNYANSVFGAYSVGYKIDNVLKAMDDLVKKYNRNIDNKHSKEDAELLKNTYKSLLDQTTKRIMAWRMGGVPIFKDLVTFAGINKKIRLNWGGTIREMAIVKRFNVLTTLFRPLPEHLANMTSSWAVGTTPVKRLSIFSDAYKTWMQNLHGTLKGTAPANKEVIGVRNRHIVTGKQIGRAHV